MKLDKYKSKLYRKNNNTCHGGVKGWDYTPLFKFLLSKVGCKWDDIYSEIVLRLNDLEPISWIVNANTDYVRVGESTYYNSLFVDINGTLQITNKNINETTLEPKCNCCTHTFNSIKFTKKFKDNETTTTEHTNFN